MSNCKQVKGATGVGGIERFQYLPIPLLSLSLRSIGNWISVFGSRSRKINQSKARSDASTSDYGTDLVVMFSLDCKALPARKNVQQQSYLTETNKPPNTPQYLKLGPKTTKA